MSAREPFEDMGEDMADALRDAWRALEPPAPDAPSGDAAEQAAAAWMRAAWHALEAPPAVPPAALRRRGRLLPFALAGGVSSLATAAVLALVVALHGRAVRHADELALASVDAPGDTIEVAAIDAGRMELRSGPVRLILLDEWTEAPASRADAR